MSNLSPEYVLKKSGEAITDLNFWNYTDFQDSSRYLLAACGGNGGTDLWDLNTRRSICNIPSVSNAATTSAYGIGDSNVVTLDKEGNLTLSVIADCASRTKVSLVLPNVAFCRAAVLEQTQTESGIIVGVPGEEKSSFNIWDLSNCKIIARLLPPNQLTLGMPMTAKLVKNNNLYACVGYEDGSLIFWDVLNHKALAVAERIYSEPIMCFDMLGKDFSGICGSATNLVTKWSFQNKVDKQFSFQTIKSVELQKAGVASIKIRPDSKIFATGGWDYKLRIFSWKTCKPLAVLEYHKGTIQALAFSRSSTNQKQLLACGANDSKISIWDIYNK